MSKKWVLVTGGAGFIGNLLVSWLRSSKKNVISIDTKPRVVEDTSNFKYYNIDLSSDITALGNVFSDNYIEMVWHLAANADIRKGTANSDVDLCNTFMSTYNVLQAMRRYNESQPTHQYQSRKIAFTSSSAVYGYNCKPLREDSGPMIPTSNYGAAKLASEAFISSYCHLYSMQAWIFRLPNVVGSGATHGVIKDFIDKLHADGTRLEILGNGKQRKPYMHVIDVIGAMMRVVKNTRDKVNICNIGPDGTTTVDAIARLVARQMKLSPRFEYTGGNRGWPGDVPSYEYNTGKLKRLVGSGSLLGTSTHAVKQAIKELT